MADIGLQSSDPDLIGAMRRGMVAPQPTGVPQPQPTGTGNLVTSALGSGVYGAAADVAQAVQAGAKLLGADNVAQSAADFAARQRATAATYQRPDLEKASLLSPPGLAYRVLQGAPQIAGALGGAAIGGMVAPEVGAAGLIGAGLASLPTAIGGNVQRYEQNTGPLTRGAAAKAIALGLPEAAIGALPAERAAGKLVGGVVGQGFAHEAASQAVAQAAAGAGQQFIAQQMDTRAMPDRAQEIISAALTGGVTGGLLGAGVHALAKSNPAATSTDAVNAAVDQTLNGTPRATPPLALPAPEPAAPPDVVHAGPPADIQTRPFAHLTDQELLGRAQSLSRNGQDQPALAAAIQEMQLRTVQNAPKQLEFKPQVAGPEPIERPDESVIPMGGPPRQLTARPDIPAEQPPAEQPAEPAAPTPNRPELDVIRPSMQERWKTAEALRSQSDDPETHQMLDDIQTRLQAPSSGGAVKAIDRDLREVRDTIAADKAKAAQVARQPEATVAPVEQPKAASDLQDALTAAKKSWVDMARMKAPDTGSAVHDKHVQAEWQQGIAEQGAKLKAIDTALKSGDVNTLANLPEDHFVNDALWSNEKLSDQQQAALDKHADLEQNVLDAARRVAPQARAASASTEVAPPVSPHDQATAQIVQNGGSLKDVLQHYVNNGSNGTVKTMANIMLKQGVDAPIQFAPPSSNPLTTPEGARIEASYGNDGTIRLYQNSDLERLVLHEGAHAATLNAIQKGGAVSREMNSLLDQARRKAPDDSLNGFKNAGEFAAEAFSNPKFREFLDSLPADEGKVTLWRAFKNVVGKIFGFQGGAKQTLLDRVMDTGQRAMAENAAAPSSDGRVYSLHTPQEADARVKGYFNVAEAVKPFVDQELIREKLGDKATNLTTGARKLGIGWQGARDLANLYGPDSPGLVKHVDTSEAKSLIRETNIKMPAAVNNLAAALPETSKKRVGAVIDFTHAGFNPEKSTAEWVADNYLDPNKPPTPELIQEQRRAQSSFANLNPVEKANYLAQKAGNESQFRQTYATLLYNTIRDAFADKIPLPEDPTALHQAAFEVHDASPDSNDFWSKQVARLQEAVKPYIDERISKAVELEAKAKAAKQATPETEKLGVQAEALRDEVEPLTGLLGEYHGRMADLAKVPNFPMGRNGGFFAAGHLPVDAEGKPDPAAIEKLQAALNDAGMGHISLNRFLDNPTFYARVENKGDSDRLAKILTAQGIDKVSNGPVAEIAATAGALPKWREKMLDMTAKRMESLKEGADEATQAAIDRQIFDMRREMLNALPDSSINKINARRAGVQGYSADWADNFRQRSTNTARMLANMATQQDHAEAALQMRQDLQTYNNRPASEVSAGQKEALQQAQQEVLNKDATSPYTKPNSFISAVNSLSHTFELGLSVPYALMLMSQNLTLGLPRLGAAVGFTNAAKLMAKHSVKSLDTLRIAMKGQDARTFGLRQSELEKAGMSKDDIDLLMNQQAMGSLNHSSYTTAMTGEHTNAEGAFNRVRQMMNMTTLYSEMQPRVLMAFAARDAWNNLPAAAKAKESMNDFVKRMIDRSQFPWDTLSTPRELTIRGVFGQMSPLINKFMGYQVRLTNELVHSLHEAFGGDKEATKFLAGHMAAITVLAGSLGLPMVGVAASVFDRMADLATGKDDWDVSAAYRNFLAQAFGKQAGEAIARGAPRVFGVDFSHLGDEKLLPGSTAALMLTEKRKLEDAEKDWLKAEAGAPMGTLANMVFAARDIANGDYLRGAQKLVPEALRGPTEAAQLLKYGYRDKSGAALPITANARDIALTALGLDPRKEAEYSEAQKTITGANTLAQFREQNITQHLALAQQRGDQDNFNYWLGQSEEYQQDHPGMRPPVMDLRRYMQQHLRQAAFAQQTGEPLGLKPRNLAGRGMVGFANLGQ